MKLINLPALALLTGVLMLNEGTAQAEPVSFSKQIAPILIDNCLACHGAKKAEGAYRVDSFERAKTAGESGIAGFVAKDLEGSEAFRRIASTDKSERMPLDGDPLPKEQIELFKRWIEEGAKYDSADPKATLLSIIPPPTHPAAPEAYRQTMPITALTFTPDGAQLIVGGYHELTVWNPADGALVRRIKNIGQRTYALAFSPDGKILAVAGGAPGRIGETRLIDFTSGNVLRAFALTSDVVLDLAFNPAGDRLATAAADSTVRVFEVATGKEQLVINSHSDWVACVAWNADGTRLMSGSRDKTAKVFDAKTGDLIITYSGHGQPVKGVAFQPDGKEAFSSGGDKKIHRWTLADGKKASEIAFGDEVYKLPSVGGFLFATSADKSVRQIDAKTAKEVRQYPGHQDWALAAACHEGTKRLATGGFNGEVKVWNIEDGKAVTSFLAAPGLKKDEPKKEEAKKEEAPKKK